MAERILVVDDEASVAALLDRRGYRVTTAASVAEAMARLGDDRFDAILLDPILGGEDGLQVLARLRETSPDTAAIVLTGHGTLPSDVRAMRLGVAEYLTKPCPAGELEAAVARALGGRRALLEARREAEAERERLLAAERAARAEAERLADRHARLQEVTAALSRAVGVADVGRAIAEQAVRATAAAAGALGVLLDDGATLELVAAAGYAEESLRRFARFATAAPVPMADAVRARAPLWIPDRAAFAARYPALRTPPGRGRIAVVPLDAGDRVLGAMSLSFPEARAFAAAERELILAVAGEGARALARARLADEARRARAEAEDAQRHLRDLFLAAPALIAVTRGPDHVVELANARFLALMGRPDAGAVLGRPVREAFPDAAPAGYVALADRVYAAGAPYVDPEMPAARDADGDGRVDRRWTSVVIQPYRDAAGRVAGLLFHGVDVTAQVEARRRSEEATRRQAFLAGASELLASSLDEAGILEALVKLAVPTLGDWCVVDLLDEGRAPRRAAVACADPAQEPLTREFLARYPPDADRETGIGRVLRTGRPVLVPAIDDALLRRTARDAREDELLRALGVRAALSVPLAVGDQALGVLSVVSASPDRPYSPADVDVVEDLGRRVALALDHARLFRAERRARERAEALQALTAGLAAARTGREIADSVVAHGAAALGARTTTVSRRAEAGDAIEVLGIVGYPPELVAPGRRFPLSLRSPVTDAAREGAPVWVESPEELAARFPEVAGAATMALSGAWAALPLEAGGRVLGVLTASYAAPHRFDPEERGFLLALARQGALALERARLAEAEGTARRRLAVLADASAAFAAASLDPAAVLDAIVRRVSGEIGDGAIVYTLSGDGRWVEPSAVHHPDPEALAFTRALFAAAPIRPDENLAGRVILTGEPILLPTVDPAELRPRMKAEHWPYFERYGVRALAVVPLRVRDRRVGALAIWRNRPDRPYAADDLTLLQDLADRAALALDNALLYARAERAVALRDEFLSVAAHELKTPLTALRGSAQLLLRTLGRAGEVAPDRLAPRLATIDQQAAKLGRLVEQLLDVSRLEAGRLALERAPADVAALARAVAETARLRTERHAIGVRGAGELVASVDAIRLEQVLTNLLDNAIKYSPDGGPIEVAVTRPSPDAVEIAVADRGLGIPPEHRARIFDRFFQAHAGAHYGGMGLGLYISRQIVELHGGTLAAEFPPEGGTRFVVRLPGAATPAPDGDRPSNGAAPR